MRLPGGMYYGWVMLVGLAFTQVTSWGILYYGFSVFLKPIGADLHWSRAAMTGAFSLALATGLRRGELQTLHWSDLDLAHRRVHVRAKAEYRFLPKDWEERTVPFSQEVAACS